jgi:hypothetical protein
MDRIETALTTLMAETVGALGAPAEALRRVARSTRTLAVLLETAGWAARNRVADRAGELRREFDEARERLAAERDSGAAITQYADRVTTLAMRAVEVLIPHSPKDTTVFLASPPTPASRPGRGDRLRDLPESALRRRLKGRVRAVHEFLSAAAGLEELVERAATGGADEARGRILGVAQAFLDARDALKPADVRGVDEYLNTVRGLHDAVASTLKA